MSLNQICSNSGVNTFTPPVSLRELNVTNNINFGSNVVVSEPSAGVLEVKSDEFKWRSNDNKDHFRCYADGVFSHYEFTGDDTGGLLCDFKVPSSENPYDIRIAVGNPSGNFIQNKSLLLFQDSTGTLAGQELLIRDSAQVGGAGIALPNTTAGYVASTLNYYEEFSATLSLAGLTSVPDIAVQIVRIGKNCTISWNTTLTGTGTGTILASAPIPLRFRPLASRSMGLPMVNNATNVIGVATIGTNGELLFSGDASLTGAFTNASSVYGGSISYNIV